MLAKGEEFVAKRHKSEGTFLDYHSMCMELLHQKELTTVPHALVRMSANILATSPTFILALNCRIRKIAQGNVNVTIIQCVLGISDSAEFESYLFQVREHNLRAMPCMQQVQVQGGRNTNNKSRTCGIRVNFGKDKCSYHLKRKS